MHSFAIFLESGSTWWTDPVLAIGTFILAAATVFLAFWTWKVAKYTRDIAREVPFAIGAHKDAETARAREEESTFYVTLDQQYHDLQDWVIKLPHLANPDCSIKTDEERVQYNAYALKVWNYLEAIVDYSLGPEYKKPDDFLKNTWHPILMCEARTHGAWIQAPENRKRFKSQFLKYIDKGGLLPGPDDGKQ